MAGLDIATSTDPVDFEEAIDYFRQKLPRLGQASWTMMEQLARGRAKVVSEALVLNLVQFVWTELEAGLETGSTFETWKKAIRHKTSTSFSGRDSTLLRLIWHNNLMTAYSAGRYQQATDPDVLADRPYWMFDAILDGRETDICHQRNATVLLASDPWWLLNHPLCHHGCRSGITTLTEAQAKKQGITVTLRADLPPVQEGWGKPPTLENDWQPAEGDYSSKVWKSYQTWLAQRAATGSAQAKRFSREVWDNEAQRLAEDLDTDEATAMARYRTAGYVDINEALRSGSTSDAQQVVVDLIDGAIAKGVAPTNAVTYRGVKKDATLKAQLLKLKPGDSFSDPAYLSTTLDPEYAQDRARFHTAKSAGIMMSLEIPKGFTCAFVGGAEDEVILPREATLEVVSITERENGGVEVVLKARG